MAMLFDGRSDGCSALFDRFVTLKPSKPRIRASSQEARESRRPPETPTPAQPKLAPSSVIPESAATAALAPVFLGSRGVFRDFMSVERHAAQARAASTMVRTSSKHSRRSTAAAICLARLGGTCPDKRSHGRQGDPPRMPTARADQHQQRSARVGCHGSIQE
jgi:hypothetical protein